MLSRLAHSSYWQIKFLPIIILACFTTTGYTMDVTLEWDANIEPDRDGYRIYFDTNSGHPYEGTRTAESNSPIDVKMADVEIGDTASYTVTGLNDDEIYFFAVTAYSTRGNESGYSNEVSTGNDISIDNENVNSGGSGCFISTLNP